MVLQLPESKPFKPVESFAAAFSDYYGAIHAASEYCSLLPPEHYFLKAIWQHGVFGPWQHFSPQVLVFGAPSAAQRPVFVARQDQAEYLRGAGFKRTRAIGMPILYTKAPDVRRIPRSLLVVPTHSLVGDQPTDRTGFARYADAVRAIAGDFDLVTVCVHPNCRRNGLWVKEFEERGIGIIYGAETNDANALLRMRLLFSQYESVTTNDWGSHVAYALAFGARVSITDFPIIHDPALYLRDFMWAQNPEGLKVALSPEVRAKRKAFLQRLHVEPAAAKTDVEFGRWLVGADQQLSPAALRATLDELVDASWRRVPVEASNVSVTAGMVASQRKRVLFVSHEASRTGAPMFLLHFLRWLRRQDVVGFELLLGHGGPLETDFAQVAVVHTPASFEKQPGALARFSLIYSNTCCNSELISKLGLDALPLVTHVHELDMAYHWLGARKMAAIIRQSARFIACAGAVSDRLTGLFGLPAERIGRHYEMIDAQAVMANAAASRAEEVRQAYGIPTDALVVMSCGTVEFRKAPDLFVQLAARVKTARSAGRPVRFVWIGAFKDEDLLRGLREDIRKLGLEQEVRLVGELSAPHGLLALCDVFCLTSREDPFPLIMLEAAALRKPVLCFDRAGGAAEFCSVGGGVTVPYLDVPAMAAVCVELLEDGARAQAVGRRASETVAARFTVEAIAPGLWSDLERFLAGPAAEQRPAETLAEIYQAWNITSAPQANQVRAQLARATLRRRADALREAGQLREAATLLVQAVGADFATKNPEIMCESLLEISQDWALFDPKQAAALAERALAIARGANVNLELYRPWPQPARQPEALAPSPELAAAEAAVP